MIHVLLLDDHQISLNGTKGWLEDKYEKKLVCHTVTDLRCAYHILQTQKIDLVISDIELNNQRKNGCELASYIKERYTDIKVIAFTNYCTYRVLQKAMDSGFDVFLSKNINYDEFSLALDKTLSTDSFVSSCQKRIIAKRKSHLEAMFKDSLYGLSLLSPKEVKVLLRLPQKEGRQELADALFIAPYTLDTHIKHLREKLSLTSKKDLALFALEFKREIVKFSS